jgi:hypothetical protein
VNDRESLIVNRPISEARMAASARYSGGRQDSLPFFIAVWNVIAMMFAGLIPEVV